MDAEAILSALVSYASANPSPTIELANLLATSPTPTPAAIGDALSEQIFSALVANALLSSPSVPLPASSVLPVKLSSFAASSKLTIISAEKTVGFLTSRLALLPSAARILLGVCLLLLGLATLTVGARGLYWGREWGRRRGEEGKGWMGGGVGGAAMGANLVGAFSAFLILAIVSRQTSPSLGGWATLAIVFFPALVGAVVGGRWSWAASGSYALVGSLSLTLLLITSLHLSALLPRLVLLLVLVLITLPLVFLRRTQRFTLPALAALSGAWLFILGVDVFPGVALGFVDALGLLCTANGVGSGRGTAESVVVRWATGGAKGLEAAWWILAVLSGAGMGYWGLGTDADESWESYLSRLIYSHPSDGPLPGQVGSHTPPLAFTQRVKAFFSRSPTSSSRLTDLPRRAVPWEEDDFDEDEKRSHHHHHYHSGQHKKHHLHLPASSSRSKSGRGETSDAWDSDVEALFPPSSPSTPLPSYSRAKSPMSFRSGRSGASKPAQYGALSLEEEEEEGADEKDEEEGKTGLWSAGLARMDSPRRPALPHRSTMTDSGMEKGSVRSGLSGSTAVSLSLPPSSPSVKEEEEGADELSALPTLSKHSSTPTRPSIPPSNAVPATPSLIRALDRVRQAQQEARSSSCGAVTRRESLKVDRVVEEEEEGEVGRSGKGLERRKSMDEWWSDVVRKSEGR
ncbi:hypothetical protein JCM8547_002032 [Rhodosporidiobolus lusitaniae]